MACTWAWHFVFSMSAESQNTAAALCSSAHNWNCCCLYTLSHKEGSCSMATRYLHMLSTALLHLAQQRKWGPVHTIRLHSKAPLVDHKVHKPPLVLYQSTLHFIAQGRMPATASLCKLVIYLYCKHCCHSRAALLPLRRADLLRTCRLCTRVASRCCICWFLGSMSPLLFGHRVGRCQSDTWTKLRGKYRRGSMVGWLRRMIYMCFQRILNWRMGCWWCSKVLLGSHSLRYGRGGIMMEKTTGLVTYWCQW